MLQTLNVVVWSKSAGLLECVQNKELSDLNNHVYTYVYILLHINLMRRTKL